MDVEIAGLNKLVCRTAAANNGKVVSVTNGTNTWTATVASTLASFMIPSMPAPAKTTYTVTLHNGDATAAALYTRYIELGFGDSVDITLDTAHEPATKGDISTASASLQSQITTLSNSLTALTSRVATVESRSTTNASNISTLTTTVNKVKGKTLVTASKSGTTLTLTSFSS